MHPDEHALLDHADGEGDPGVAAHVESCEACRVQVRLLRAGRDALRTAPLLELAAERRRTLVAGLPERSSRLGDWRGRLGPAAAAAAALVLVAGIIALATLAGGRSGGDEGGGEEAGEAEVAESPEPAATGTARTLSADLGPPVRRVEGPTEAVIRLLRRRGIPAVRRDGAVVAPGDRGDVLAALAGRAAGRVAVYVR